MDNLAAHKVADVESAIRAVGTSVLYLPAYSPNPIVKMFVKLKTLLRKAKARTIEEPSERDLSDHHRPHLDRMPHIASSGYAFE